MTPASVCINFCRFQARKLFSLFSRARRGRHTTVPRPARSLAFPRGWHKRAIELPRLGDQAVRARTRFVVTRRSNQDHASNNPAQFDATHAPPPATSHLFRRLGALEHYHRAYGCTPPFATRPDAAAFGGFIHMGEEPVPQYHRAMPHPPPPPPTSDDRRRPRPTTPTKLGRPTSPDLAAGDAREHARLGQKLRRHVGPSAVQTAVISD